MIPRTLEPELMDTAEEAAAYDAMDHAEVNRQHVDDFLAALHAHRMLPTPFEAAASEGAAPLAILDLGTGTAQIPIELCRREPALTVVGVDGAVHMLDLAERNVQAAGLDGRIELLKQDSKSLSLGGKTFPVVMSNSLMHHIPAPEDVLAEALRATAPDGLIWIRDLMRPTDAATLGALVADYAGQETPQQWMLFSNSLQAALTLDEMRALVEQFGYDGRQVEATSDRHWTWVARKGVRK